MTPTFVDISVFNPIDINWQAYKQWSAQGDGASRVAMRSSYGVGFTDQHFVTYRAGALAAGIDVLIMYHYGYPQYNSYIDEANWQRQVTGNIRPQDLIVLDYEENVIQATANWAYDWLQAQEANYGKLPGLYASSSYIAQRLQDARLAKYPLWLANWQFTPDERPPVPSPWSSYEFVQYTDRATNISGIPGTVDANIFLGGDPPMKQYGPGQGDFDSWFTVSNGNWVCKKFNTVLLGGNRDLYAQVSIDGNTLPVVGLPRTNEIYQTESDGYGWSVQFCERGVIVYDPAHRQDEQPGFGASYLGKYAQFQYLDPDAKVVERVPAPVLSSLGAIQSEIEAVIKVASQ